MAVDSFRVGLIPEGEEDMTQKLDPSIPTLPLTVERERARERINHQEQEFQQVCFHHGLSLTIPK